MAGANESEAVRLGLEAIAKALELNPKMARAHAVHGALLLEKSATGTDAARAQASEALATAFEIKPQLRREFAQVWRQAEGRQREP